MQDILEVVALLWQLRIEQFQELLNELSRNIRLDQLRVYLVTDDYGEEEFVDALQMGPGWVDVRYLLHTRLRVVHALFDARQWAEYVSLYHVHDLIQVRHNKLSDQFLVVHHGADLVECIDTLSFTLKIARSFAVVELATADSELLHKVILGVSALGWLGGFLNISDLQASPSRCLFHGVY